MIRIKTKSKQYYLHQNIVVDKNGKFSTLGEPISVGFSDSEDVTKYTDKTNNPTPLKSFTVSPPFQISVEQSMGNCQCGNVNVSLLFEKKDGKIILQRKKTINDRFLWKNGKLHDRTFSIPYCEEIIFLNPVEIHKLN